MVNAAVVNQAGAEAGVGMPYEAFARQVTVAGDEHIAGRRVDGRYRLEIGVVPPYPGLEQDKVGLEHMINNAPEAQSLLRRQGIQVESQKPEVAQSDPQNNSEVAGSVLDVEVVVPSFVATLVSTEEWDVLHSGWVERTSRSLWTLADAAALIIKDAANRHRDPQAMERHNARLGRVAIPRPNPSELDEV